MADLLSDKEMNAAYGIPEPPASIDDALRRIDRLERELWNIQDRLQVWMFWLFLAIAALLYKAYF